ncbi:uncharacterized protein BO87DRAFT_366671 [Aspergillus neoniger CBS 115656]|uniref:F-box domain-containing protein n=1 Tax=Aspergillus neoniger (strain CBS 115656) TaxID=1448310 RepID=A0A318Y9H3_ASPNB|nr:hypothetical protein BO87DRAFT_366671 [Aspergillus neoniger CBS 115656]PYH30599.1 hypothetical protein BO87DRAFT_366671 [Aspergillus neoniger CBS 115656]
MNKLPPELIDAIGSHFDYSDWCALRLTCKIFYQLSSSLFAKRYFQYVSVILTREAIAELEDLTSNESFRNEVKELSLIPQVFGDYGVDLDAFTSILHLCVPESQEWTAKEVQAQYAIYVAAETDHLAFAESASLVGSLTRCLSRMRNVSTIGLRAYPSQRLCKEKSPHVCLGRRALRERLPFGPCAQLLVSTARRSADPSPSMRRVVWDMWVDIRHPVWTKGLTSLLEAMCAVSPTLAVQRLYTCLTEDEFAVPPDCFTLSQHLYHSLQPILHVLVDLDICLGPPKPEDTAESLHYLVVRAAPNLQILRLTLWDQFHDLSPDHFTNLAQQVQFTRLSELHLHWVELTIPGFQLFLRTAAPTLKVLTLVAVSLNGPVPVARRPAPAFHEAISTVWRGFLITLRDTIPTIRFLRMRGLAYRQHMIRMTDPSRKTTIVPRGSRIVYKSARGIFYDINTRMSFAEWIDQLELRPQYDGFMLFRLPRHRVFSDGIIDSPFPMHLPRHMWPAFGDNSIDPRPRHPPGIIRSGT